MSEKSLGREVFGVVFRALVITITIMFGFSFLTVMYEGGDSIGDGICNVAVLPIEGVILPFHGIGDYPLTITPQTVRDFMDRAEEDPSILAVLVEINSPGGTPVAAEYIAERLANSTLPTIGLIGDMGASGGYLVAAATSPLIASTMSDVGGIGVTMSYIEESEKNKEEGLTFVDLAAGKFKDAGNPNKPLTDDERTRFEADLDVVYQAFIDQVAIYRGLSRDVIADLADGATMPGIRALEMNLIDHIGGREKAREILAEQLSLDVNDIIFCEYNEGLYLF